MSYPLIVFILAAVIITSLFTFIIPQFATILSDMTYGGRLPGLTRVFLGLAHNFIPFWTGLGLVVVGLVILSVFLSTFRLGRRIRESFFLRIPVLGRIYHSSMLSRLAEAMAIMVNSGADMPEALRASSGASGSEVLIYESNEIANQLEHGANLMEAGQVCKMIPKLFLYSMQLGSQRNELQDNLYSLGQMYAEQAIHGQSRLQAVLLPLMLIFVGCFIGLTIISIFLPVISIITTLSSGA
jgi:type II secretory pathway component PulF